MKDGLRRFMMGRYGVDQFGKFILGVAVVLLFASVFIPGRIVSTLATFALILCYYRMFSKNVNKRYSENQKFLQKRNLFLSYFQKGNSNRKQGKNYRIYACPTCKQKIRIPKGKGKICIICPKCHAEFIKKS